METEGAFEGTREEQLRLENELLRLKMQAELGANFFGGMSTGDIPPEVEQQFLQQIMAFHQNLDKQTEIPLREYLGFPVFPESSALSPEKLEKKWAELQKLLNDKSVRVDFITEYPLAHKYDFIVCELFDFEIASPLPEGMISCFIYEEIHPDYDRDLRDRAKQFFQLFFGAELPDHKDSHLDQEFFSPGGKDISREKLRRLLDDFHGMFSEITDWEFTTLDTSYQSDEELKEDFGPRLGYAQGEIRYDVVLHDGETMEIEGPFKLLMQCIAGYWEVFCFRLHGFDWGEPPINDDDEKNDESV